MIRGNIRTTMPSWSVQLLNFFRKEDLKCVSLASRMLTWADKSKWRIASLELRQSLSTATFSLNALCQSQCGWPWKCDHYVLCERRLPGHALRQFHENRWSRCYKTIHTWECIPSHRRRFMMRKKTPSLLTRCGNEEAFLKTMGLRATPVNWLWGILAYVQVLLAVRHIAARTPKFLKTYPQNRSTWYDDN